jgi:teichuronic acid biosynthesis glycosyltransferase TuaH
MNVRAEADDVVIVIAATSWDGIWMSERHLALRLADQVPVLWVDPPMSRLTARRNPHLRQGLAQPRLRPVAPGLWRLTPVTIPGPSRRGLRILANAQVRRAVRKAVRSLRVRRVRAVIVASLVDLLGVVPAERTMLYGTDDWVAGAELMGLNRAALERDERRQVLRADVVTAVSEPLIRRWAKYREDVVLVPNGCDVERFAGTDQAVRPDDVTVPEPIAGFVGHLSNRISLAHLEAVADTGVSLLLVGPRQPTFAIARIEALIARPNVQWVGAKDFTELPSYLRMITVGLTPYADSDFNRVSFPLKTLEYLAAGRPVVATDLPAARWLDTPFVTVAGSPEDYAAEVQQALKVEPDAEVAAARRAFAERHSWSERAQQIVELLDLVPAERRR